jgi:predicted nucleic acid-binding protein
MARFFEDEASAYADAVEDSLAHSAAVVPTLWHQEVANVLLVAERRKRTTEAKSGHFLQLFASLRISVDEVIPAQLWPEWLRLGRAYGLSAYDAVYLEMALRRGLPLATLDDPLKAAAAATGVQIFQPIK